MYTITPKEWFEKTFEDKAERFDAYQILYQDHITNEMITASFGEEMILEVAGEEDNP